MESKLFLLSIILTAIIITLIITNANQQNYKEQVRNALMKIMISSIDKDKESDGMYQLGRAIGMELGASFVDNITIINNHLLFSTIYINPTGNSELFIGVGICGKVFYNKTFDALTKLMKS